MLVNAGTRGGNYLNANGTTSMDWLINTTSGTQSGLDLVQNMPAQYAISATDAFLNFTQAVQGFLSKNAGSNAGLYIAGESQAGLANQIQLTVANQLHMNNVQAFGTNTLNLSNDDASDLTDIFAYVNYIVHPVGDPPDYQPSAADALSIRNLLYPKTEDGSNLPPSLIVDNITALRDIAFSTNNGYSNYTILGRTNDQVDNIAARPSSATNYWMAPNETFNQYFDERVADIQTTFPNVNINDTHIQGSSAPGR